MTTSTDLGTIWACVDCMFVHASGETEGEPDRAPWGILEGGQHVTLGLTYGEHTCGKGQDHDRECDCETEEFSWSTCEGCGSRLGGSRHAFTLWEDL